MMSFAVIGKAFQGVPKTGSRMMINRALSMNAGGVSEDMKPFYALGVNVANRNGAELKSIMTKEEISVMLEGYNDSMNDKVANDREILMTYGPQLNEILTGRAEKSFLSEKDAGLDYFNKYLLSNVKALKSESGMIYDETLAGTGAQATPESTVTVHYHGTLTDGSTFDSSVDRGEPIKFPLTNVIKGWQEGVSMMREGGRAKLVIPSELAYGDAGSPPIIRPGATLIFEVELIAVA